MSELSTADRLEIGEVLARYCHCVDRGRWEELPELFTADGTLDLSQVMGRYEGSEAIRGFCSTLRALPIVMRHLTTNVVIRGEGNAARSECYVLAITAPEGGTASQTTGFYDDEWVKQDGRWKIRSRRLALDIPAH